MKYLDNYKECITNIGCSILKHFNLEHRHNGICEIDKILENNEYKNIVVILCDGMGSELLSNTLEPGSFLLENTVKNINSVYPSTTTAATTSILSGLNPVEHGWLGWDLYIKPVNKIVTMFLNTLKDTDELVSNDHVSQKYFPYESIVERINKDTLHTGKEIFPFGNDAYYDFDDMLTKIKKETQENGKKYVYAYYENPDSLLHNFGVGSDEVIQNITNIDEKLSEFSKELKDTLLIITADHGHINCNPITLSEDTEIFKLIDGDIWIEARFTAFRVSDENIAEFTQIFRSKYSKDFELYTKEEIKESGIFGDGEPNELFEESLGDLFAIATGDKYFRYNNNSVLLKSMHAGITREEMSIPLIIKHCM